MAPRHLAPSPPSPGTCCRTLSTRWKAQITALPAQTRQPLTDARLATLPNLRRLDLWCNAEVTNRSLLALTHLTELSLKGNTTITDEGLVPLAPTLISLNLSGVPTPVITDAALARLTGLQTLNLASNTLITSQSLTLLTNLTSLNLSRQNNIDGKALVGLPNLHFLKYSPPPLLPLLSLLQPRLQHPPQRPGVRSPHAAQGGRPHWQPTHQRQRGRRANAA